MCVGVELVRDTQVTLCWPAVADHNAAHLGECRSPVATATSCAISILLRSAR
ncbi:hypothetical protein HmCmsJML041_03368 [Escherichia coli]|nr:hypothetical protein HmCmsJML041_03368 [Escherichia coli]